MVRNFTIFGVNPKSELRDLTSIVALDRSSPDAQYYIFVRGDHITMKNLLYLKHEEKTYYRNAMVKYKNLLLNRLVYAYRKLSEKEISKYHNTFARMIFNNRVDSAEIDRLAVSLESNLRFIGCLGLKTKIRPDAFMLIKNLKEAELKTSILSGDTFENTLNIVRELKLLNFNHNDKTSFFDLSFDSSERGRMDCNTYMSRITNDIKSINNQKISTLMSFLDKKVSGSSSSKDSKKLIGDLEASTKQNAKEFNGDYSSKIMVISGDCLSIIQRNKDLLPLLKVLTLFSDSFLGYDLSPSQKGYLVQLLRDKKEVVLAIGDGLNDMMMFKQANLSIQIASKEVEFLFGDLVVNNLDIIPYLLFHSGFNGSKNIRFAVIVGLTIVTKSVVINIWYFFMTDYTARMSRHTPMLVLLSLLAAVAQMFSPEVYPNRFVSRNLIVYKERLVLRRQFGGIVLLFFSSVALDLMFYYFVISTQLTFFNQQSGYILSESAKNLIVDLSFTFSTFVMNYQFVKHSKLQCVVLMVLYIGYILLTSVYVISYPFDESIRSYLKGLSSKSFLSLRIIAIVVPAYFAFVFSALIVNRYMNPIRYLLSAILKLGDQWKNHNNASETNSYLLKYIHMITLFFGQSHQQLVRKISKMVRSDSQNELKNLLSGLLMLNPYEYKIGFNHITNSIYDKHKSDKFNAYFTSTHLRYTKFLMIVCCSLFCLYISIRVVQAAAIEAKYKFLYLYIPTYCSICLAVFLLIIWRFGKMKDSLVFLLITALTLLLLVIDVLMKFVGMKYAVDDRLWLPVDINSRFVNSAIPINFLWSSVLVVAFDLVFGWRLLFDPSPISSRSTGVRDIGTLASYLVAIAFMKILMNKKVRLGNPVRRDLQDQLPVDQRAQESNQTVDREALDADAQVRLGQDKH